MKCQHGRDCYFVQIFECHQQQWTATDRNDVYNKLRGRICAGNVCNYSDQKLLSLCLFPKTWKIEIIYMKQ
jgi:hypothetical protein